MTRLPLTTSPSSPLNFPRCSSASRLSSDNKYKKFTSTDIDWSARQRACCHLSASKWTRPTERPQSGAQPAWISLKPIDSEPVVIWLQLQLPTASITCSSSSNQQSRFCSSRQTWAKLRMINTCSSNTWWWLTQWPISSQLLDLKVQQDCIWFQ